VQPLDLVLTNISVFNENRVTLWYHAHAYMLWVIAISRVVRMPASLTRPPARYALLCPLCSPARPTRKYSSIFEHIQVYLRYFKNILKKYVQYVRFVPDVMDRTARPPEKYSSIFEHIQVYLRYLKKIQRICPVCTGRNG
jgi:hypothetical protein